MAPSSRKSALSRAGNGAPSALPWLTALLALACAVGFGTQMVAERSSERAVQGQLADAAQFLLERPYLLAPEMLEEHIGAEHLQDARSDFERRLERRGAPPIPPGVKRRHQEELDKRMDQARSLLRDVPAQRWGLVPGGLTAEAMAGHPFVHLGWLHVLGTLGLLFVLGVALEASLGTVVVAFIAIVSATGAGLGFVYGNTAEAPYLGMTGLLAGLLGAFLVRPAGAREGASSGLGIAVGAFVLLLPAAIGLELAVARPGGLEAPTPGVWNASNWALVGGFAGGLLAALAVRVLGVEAALSPSAASGRRNKPLERALAQARAGDAQKAYKALVEILRRDPDEHDAAVALWELAVKLGRTEAAAPALLRAIRSEVERGELDAAVAHWMELVSCELDTRADPGQLIRMATLLRSGGEPQAAVRALRTALDRAAGSAVASRIAREASLLDPKTAELAAWRALGSLELDLPERQSLETLLAELQPRLASQLAPTRERPHHRPEAPAAAAADRAAAPTPSEGAIDFEEKVRPMECAVGVPVGFDREGLQVEVESGRKRRVRFDRIEAVSVVSVDGLASQPVILVDLILNWMSLTAEPLRLIRLRTDRFDPRRLVPTKEDPLEALRTLVKRLLQKTNATPLPDLQSASGMPFAGFGSLAAYQRDVLMVETPEEA